MKSKFKTAKIVSHYTLEDEECGGDYYDIEVFIDGKLVKRFGDYYHDKGDLKAEAFVDGISFAQGSKIKVEYENVSDREE